MKFSSIVSTLKSTSTPDLENPSRSGAFSFKNSDTAPALTQKGLELRFSKILELNKTHEDPANIKSIDREPTTLVPVPLMPMETPRYDFKLHSNRIPSKDIPDSDNNISAPIELTDSSSLYVDVALLKLHEVNPVPLNPQSKLGIPDLPNDINPDISNAATVAGNPGTEFTGNVRDTLLAEYFNYKTNLTPGDAISLGSELGDSIMDKLFDLSTHLLPFDPFDFANLRFNEPLFGGEIFQRFLFSDEEANGAPSDQNEIFIFTQGDEEKELGNKLANALDPDGDTLFIASLQNPSVDISGVTPLANKLPGLTVTVSDNDFSDGSGQVKISTSFGDAFEIVASDGTASFLDPNNIFNQLDFDDVLLINVDYLVSDGQGNTITSTETIEIHGTNEPPIDEDEVFTFIPQRSATEGEEGVTQTLGNKLANASDPNGDLLVISSLNSASADTSGVTSLDTKLPGLTIFVSDNDFSDGSGTITIHTNNGDAIETVFSDGTAVMADPNNIFGALGHNDFLQIIANYTISDGHGGTDTSNETIQIEGLNFPPTANPDSFSATEDQLGTISLGNKISNDTDPEGDVLVVLDVDLATPPITLTGAGSFTDADVLIEKVFTFLDGFVDGSIATFKITTTDNIDFGSDPQVAFIYINPNGDEFLINNTNAFNQLSVEQSLKFNFIYDIVDIKDSLSSSTQDVTINGLNDPPIDADEVFLFSEKPGEGPVEVLLGNKLANASDPEGDSLVITSLDSPSVDTTGVALPDITIPQITVNITDNNFTDGFGEITIQINNGSSTLSATELIASDGTATLLDPNRIFSNLSHGDVLKIIANYTVSDGHGGTDTSKETIEIHGFNHNPVDDDETFIVTEGEEQQAEQVMGNKLDGANDSDSDPLSIISLQNPTADTSGIIPLGNKLPGLTVTVTDNDFNDGFGQVTIHTDAGDAIETVASDGTATFSDPNYIFNALNFDDILKIMVSYTLSDGHGGTDISTETIMIKGQVDPTIANPDHFSVTENQTDQIFLGNKITGEGTPSFEGKDINVDEMILTVFQVNLDNPKITLTGAGNFGDNNVDIVKVTTPMDGLVMGSVATFKITTSDNTDANTDPQVAYIYINPNGDEFLINNNDAFAQLALGQSLKFNFTYSIMDEVSQVSSSTQDVTVTGLNDSPTANPDHFSANEDQTGTILLDNKLSNDVDLDGDSLSVTNVDVVQPPVLTGAGSFTLGNVTISEVFTVPDGFVPGSVATFKITTTDNIDAGNDSQVAFIYVNPNGDEFLVNNNNSFDQLGAGQSLKFNFTYSISDSHGGTSNSTQDVTIIGQDDCPIVTMVCEDSAIVLSKLLDFAANQQNVQPLLTNVYNAGDPLETDDSENFATLPNGVINGLGPVFVPGGPGISITPYFYDESAGFQNTFGGYTVDPTTGVITNVQFFWTNASAQDSGGTLLEGNDLQPDPTFLDGSAALNPMNIAADTTVGFFLVADGYDANNNYAGITFDAKGNITNGNLVFVKNGTTEAQVESNFANIIGGTSSFNAHIDTPGTHVTDASPDLWFINSTTHQATQIQSHASTSNSTTTPDSIFHSAAIDTGSLNTLSLNPDNSQHVWSATTSDGNIVIGFEDLLKDQNTGLLGDNDYNDMIFVIHGSVNFEVSSQICDVTVHDPDGDPIVMATVHLDGNVGDRLVFQGDIPGLNSSVSADGKTLTLTSLNGLSEALYSDFLDVHIYNPAFVAPGVYIDLAKDANGEFVGGDRTISIQVLDDVDHDCPTITDTIHIASDGGAYDDQNNNLIIGSANNDNLFGFDGDDFIIGGAGIDTISGGNGDDVFDFNLATNFGQDHITDMGSSTNVNGHDTINLHNVIDQNADTLITIDDLDTNPSFSVTQTATTTVLHFGTLPTSPTITIDNIGSNNAMINNFHDLVAHAHINVAVS